MMAGAASGVPSRDRGADLAALVAGGLLPLAFAPFGWWWLAVLCPAVLFRLWLDCRPRRAAWRGWLFGVGMWGTGVYWVYHSLHFFGAAIAPLAAAITAVFVLALALIPAILGGLVTRGDPERRGAVWLILVAPAAWVGIEWVRSWLLTGFPWLLLGNSQLDTPLAGHAPLVGVYGVSLAVAFTAGVMAALPRVAGGRRLLLLIPVIGLWLGGALLEGHRWTRPDGAPLRAALVQGNVDQDEKFASLRRSIDLYTDETRSVAGDADVVVWPETAIPTFWGHVADELNAFRLELGDTEVVTGIFTTEPETGLYHNSIRTLGPSPTTYSKQRLVPFGEYLPLRDWLGFLDAIIEIPMSDLTPPEEEQSPLMAGGVAMAAFVCYEAAYPDVIRRLAQDAGVLVNVSNDAWFGDSTAPAQHLEIARMRSLETARPMIRATNTGISAFIDHRGGIGRRGPRFEAITLTHEIQPRTGATPFMVTGNHPVLMLIGLMLVGGIAGGVGSAGRGTRRDPQAAPGASDDFPG